MTQAHIKDDRRASPAPEPAARRSAAPDSAKQPSTEPVQKNWLRRHPYAAAAAAVVVLLALAAMVLWWLNARHYETTDDAFVDARNVTISSQVMGAIINVPVTDNEL